MKHPMKVINIKAIIVFKILIENAWKVPKLMRNVSTKLGMMEVKMCQIDHWSKETWNRSTIKEIIAQVQVIQPMKD